MLHLWCYEILITVRKMNMELNKEAQQKRKMNKVSYSE